jgi:hypothetical protein
MLHSQLLPYTSAMILNALVRNSKLNGDLLDRKIHPREDADL